MRYGWPGLLCVLLAGGCASPHTTLPRDWYPLEGGHLYEPADAAVQWAEQPSALLLPRGPYRFLPVRSIWGEQPLPEWTASLSGHAYDGQDAAAPALRAWVRCRDHRRVVAAGDGDGSFHLPRPDAGVVLLDVSADGYATSTVHARPGDPVEVPLFRATSIQLTLVDRTGAPLVGAVVDAGNHTRSGDVLVSGWRSARTDANGRVTLDGLVPHVAETTIHVHLDGTLRLVRTIATGGVGERTHLGTWTVSDALETD